MNSKRTSNKRCSKYYLFKCFEERRKYSPNLEYEKEILKKFLEKYKNNRGRFDFSSFGRLCRDRMFEKIFDKFLRLHSFGGTIKV